MSAWPHNAITISLWQLEMRKKKKKHYRFFPPSFQTYLIRYLLNTMKQDKIKIEIRKFKKHIQKIIIDK